jgi:uracil-DNA glycosylase
MASEEFETWNDWLTTGGWSAKLERIESDTYINNTARIFPNRENLYKALELCPLSEVKIVLLGQDPYHGLNQANGLAFGVSEAVAIPPSLKNIFSEIQREYKDAIFPHGDLSNWATQGVLLLNTILSVEEGKPLSHQKKGWFEFTQSIITRLDQHQKPVVFMLWGKFANGFINLIQNPDHLILKTSHPSPLSVHKGFRGCGHFRMANDFLVSKGRKPIHWSL